MVKNAKKSQQKKSKPVKETKKKIKKPVKSSKKPAVQAVKKEAKKEKQAKAKPVPATPVAKRPKREAKTKKKSEITVVYDAVQLEKYKDLKKSLQAKSNAELKEMLKKNDQTCTGTKDELIEKIADGKVLGKIPRCTHCFGGRLRFDFKTGIYNCPGYRDDTDFHNCQKKFQFGEIKRDSWVD